jgi:hypothetical protein
MVGGTWSRYEIEPSSLNFPACGTVEILTESVENITTFHLKHPKLKVLIPEHKFAQISSLTSSAKRDTKSNWNSHKRQRFVHAHR